jgi:hypothetical protein
MLRTPLAPLARARSCQTLRDRSRPDDRGFVASPDRVPKLAQPQRLRTALNINALLLEVITRQIGVVTGE